MLLELQLDTVQQTEVDLQYDDEVQESTLDKLNLRNGRGTVLIASARLGGDRRAWSM